MKIGISSITTKRAELLCDAGNTWIEFLPGVVESALDEIHLSFVRTLHADSESYLAVVKTSDGLDRVLKVLLPNDIDVTAEIAGFKAANGLGYAFLFESDETNHTLVLEPLSAPMANSGLSTEDQLHMIANVLTRSWHVSSDQPGLFYGGRPAGESPAANSRAHWQSHR